MEDHQENAENVVDKDTEEEGAVFLEEGHQATEIEIDKSAPIEDDDVLVDEGNETENALMEDVDAEEAAEAAEAGPAQADWTEQASKRYTAHPDSVYAVHLNPAAATKLCVSGGGDDKARVWNYQTGDTLFIIEGHTDTVNNVAFSSDGKLVAAGSMDGSISVYDVETHALVSKLEGPAGDIEFVTWHPKGPVLLAGSTDSTVWMWTAKDGKCMQVFSGHMGPVLCGGFSHDGKVVITGSEDGSVIVWNPRAASPIFHFKGEKFHEGPLNCLAFHPTERLIITGSQDGTCCYASADTGKVLSKFKGHSDSVEAVGFCHNLKLAATASLDNSVKIWDLSTGACRVSLQHDMGVVALKWVATEPLLFTASLDHTIRCWDARTGQEVNKWRAHRDAVLGLDVSSDGKVVVSCSDDKTAAVFCR